MARSYRLIVIGGWISGIAFRRIKMARIQKEKKNRITIKGPSGAAMPLSKQLPLAAKFFLLISFRLERMAERRRKMRRRRRRKRRTGDSI